MEEKKKKFSERFKEMFYKITAKKSEDEIRAREDELNRELTEREKETIRTKNARGIQIKSTFTAILAALGIGAGALMLSGGNDIEIIQGPTQEEVNSEKESEQPEKSKHDEFVENLSSEYEAGTIEYGRIYNSIEMDVDLLVDSFRKNPEKAIELGKDIFALSYNNSAEDITAQDLRILQYEDAYVCYIDGKAQPNVSSSKTPNGVNSIEIVNNEPKNILEFTINSNEKEIYVEDNGVFYRADFAHNMEEIKENVASNQDGLRIISEIIKTYKSGEKFNDLTEEEQNEQRESEREIAGKLTEYISQMDEKDIEKILSGIQQPEETKILEESTQEEGQEH